MTRSVFPLIWCILSIALFIGACGQKGSLYLPQNEQPDRQMQKQDS
ncbi:MAG: lipoprotein [Candidatus Thiodiazotropha sp. (ex Dulcina madagascariensis)]|nr:lipoprotein [Candidatus Thiodiazotropha sp. (ex Dulcina madagascariensis)]MCU7925793.1 lipoprotein [Candidatus Thiodiazotropha sp. (ex Dulcina madagascariensis)]